jgi:LEA14-like dessication related protein
MRIILVLAFSYLLFTGCTKPQAAEYLGIQNISIQNFAGNNAQLNLEVKLFNPNKFEIKLWSMEADCMLANKMVGKASVDSLILMPPNQETIIPVSTNIELSEILSNSISLLLGAELIYNVKGTAKAGKGSVKWNIPFNQSGKLDKTVIQKLFR